MADNEQGIKEVKKEGIRSTTVRLPTLFIRSSTLCLTLKALLFFISFNHYVSCCSSYCIHLGILEVYLVLPYSLIPQFYLPTESYNELHQLCNNILFFYRLLP